MLSTFSSFLLTKVVLSGWGKVMGVSWGAVHVKLKLSCDNQIEFQEIAVNNEFGWILPQSLVNIGPNFWKYDSLKPL